MAVVQISRIQVRRGQKNTGTGIPQLASGEFGWAIDERELYIGNGSISEGAPTVGNTKILTEFTDILGEAAKYSYKPDEITTGTAGNIVRTLQEKLDDVVSVLDFGVANDGTVQTAAIQRAIDNLYLGPDVQGLSPEGRVVLRFPAGEYQIDGPVSVPPFATLMGDGSERTIINVTGQYGFYTVNGDSTPSNPAGSELIGTPATTLANQARSITIKGMTLNKTTFDGALVLQSCRDSHFEDLIIQGAWSLGDGFSLSEDNSFTYSYPEFGQYYVELTVYGANNCFDITSNYVTIYPTYSVYIPNSFSPDLDQINESFAPIGIGIYNYEIEIFNRWGEPIFKSENSPWFANDVIQGLYLYTIRLEDYNGRPYKYQGTVRVIR